MGTNKGCSLTRRRQFVLIVRSLLMIWGLAPAWTQTQQPQASSPQRPQRAQHPLGIPAECRT